MHAAVRGTTVYIRSKLCRDLFTVRDKSDWDARLLSDGLTLIDFLHTLVMQDQRTLSMYHFITRVSRCESELSPAETQLTLEKHSFHSQTTCQAESV